MNEGVVTVDEYEEQGGWVLSFIMFVYVHIINVRNVNIILRLYEESNL